MNKFLTLAAVIALTPMPASSATNQTGRVETLLASMTLEEKIGQMVQLDLMTVVVSDSSPIQLDEAKLRKALVTYKIGSFINNGIGRALSLDEWRYVHNSIQDMIEAERKRREKSP